MDVKGEGDIVQNFRFTKKQRGNVMAINSSIEWTESTWNPVTGCTKISPGCKHCYAERMAKRLQAMGQPNYTVDLSLLYTKKS